jgi:hypothetical protein
LSISDAYWANVTARRCRTFEALIEATGRALSAVTKENVEGFFTHRAYGILGELSL